MGTMGGYKKIREVPCWNGQGKKSLWKLGGESLECALVIKIGTIVTEVTPYYKRCKEKTLYFGRGFCELLGSLVGLKEG